MNTISSRTRTRCSNIPGTGRRRCRVIAVAIGGVPSNLFIIIVRRAPSVDQRSEWHEAGDEEERGDEELGESGEWVPEVFVVSSTLFGGCTIEAVVNGNCVVERAEEKKGGDDEEDGVVAH